MRFIAWLLLLVCASEASAGNLHGVGVIPFFHANGEIYVLLADHSHGNRGWGTFGGRLSGNESPAQAAARELREETRCVYDYDEAALTSAPGFRYLTSHTYVLEVPYVPANVFARRELPADCVGSEFRERGPYAWFPLKSVLATVEQPDAAGAYFLDKRYVPDYSRYRLELWPFVAGSFVLAKELGLLPQPESM